MVINLSWDDAVVENEGDSSDEDTGEYVPTLSKAPTSSASVSREPPRSRRLSSDILVPGGWPEEESGSSGTMDTK